jgi:transcription initiation factor TFIID subunit 2
MSGQQWHNLLSAIPHQTQRKFHYHVLHNKLSLHIDPNKQFIKGKSQILLLLLANNLKVVTINQQQFKVLNVSYNDIPCEFTVATPATANYSKILENNSTLGLQHVRDYTCYEYYMDEKTELHERGELIIQIPPQLQNYNIEDKIPIKLTIDYELDKPQAGIYFVNNSEINYNNASDFSTSNTVDNYTIMSATNRSDPSLWFPCVDSITSRCTYDVSYTVPSHYSVISTGRRQNDTTNSDENTRTYRFTVVHPILARHLGFFATTKLHEIRLSSSVSAYIDVSSIDSNANKLVIKQLQFVAPALLSIFNCFEEYLEHDFPYSHYHFVFSSHNYSSNLPYPDWVLLRSSLLFDHQQIDPVYDTLGTLAWSIAWSWISSAIYIESAADIWLLHAIASHLVFHFTIKELGQTEAEYLNLERSIYVSEADMDQNALNSSYIKRYYPNRPLYWLGYHSETELDNLLFRRKAAVVIRMLENRIGYNNLRDSILELCDESHVEINSDKTKATSTKRFLNIAIEQTTDAELQLFWNEWIYGTEYPELNVFYYYNAKKKMTSIDITQSQASAIKFSGIFKMRIVECERQSIQERKLEEQKVDWDFVCSSKVRRNRKRKQYQLAELQRLPVEKLLTRYNETPLLYVRVDTNNQWFNLPNVNTNQIYSIQQTTEEKDLYGQFSGLQAIKRLLTGEYVPNQLAVANIDDSNDELAQLNICGSACTEIIQSNKHFYKIRMEAVKILCIAANNPKNKKQRQKFIEALFKYFNDNYIHAATNTLKPNNFNDFSQYFVKKFLPLHLSNIKWPQTTSTDAHAVVQLVTPIQIVKLLLFLITENDNTRNPFDDSYYKAALIESLGNIVVSEENKALRKQVVNEISRILEYDLIVQSHNQIISQQAILALATLQLNNQFSNSNYKVIQYDKYLHPSLYRREVRIAAWKAILLLLNTNYKHFSEIIIHQLEIERMPGMRYSFSIMLVQGIVYEIIDPKPFRLSTATNRFFQDRIWHLLLTTADSRFRDCLSRLFAALYGQRINSELASKVEILYSKELKTAYDNAMKAIQEGEGDNNNYIFHCYSRRMISAEQLKAMKVLRQWDINTEVKSVIQSANNAAEFAAAPATTTKLKFTLTGKEIKLQQLHTRNQEVDEDNSTSTNMED